MVEKYGEEGSRGLVHGPAYESADVPDYYFVDGFSTQLAISTMKDHLKKAESASFPCPWFCKATSEFCSS